MGSIELRKYDADIRFKDGRLVTNLPIDWDKTLKLWSEDEEAYKNKTLIKVEQKELFKVFYNKRRALFNNRSFYTWECNRELKKKISKRFKEGLIDAFKANGRIY